MDNTLPRVARVVTLVTLLPMALSLVGLLSHESQDPAVFGRYSLAYFAFLLAQLGLIAVIGMTLFVSDTYLERLEAGARRSFSDRARTFLSWALLIGILPLLIATLTFAQRWEHGGMLSRQVGLAATALWILVMFTALFGSRALLKHIGSGIAFCTSLALAFAMVETVLRFRQDLIPEPVMQWLPGGGRYLRASDFVEDKPLRVGYRFRPMQDRWVFLDAFDPGVGGVTGVTGPYGAPHSEPLKLHFVTDENGFLNKPPVNGRQFDIVAVGDSFMGMTAEVLWTDLLSELTGNTVLNLGNSGWGTQAEVEALKLYGLPKKPKWVVLAYFEGNDLWDVARYEQKKNSGLTWIEHDLKSAGFWSSLVTPKLFSYYAEVAKNRWRKPDYVYPVSADIGGRTLRLELTGQYVGVLTAPKDLIAKSHSLGLVRRSFREAQRVTKEAGARLLVVYIPAEPHIYLPYIREVDRPRIAAAAPGVRLSEEGYLAFSPTSPHPDALLGHLDDQAEIVKSIAHEQGIDFINLTERFSAEAAKGQELYNYSDTHWNAAGHALAAQVIAERIMSKDQ